MNQFVKTLTFCSGICLSLAFPVASQAADKQPIMIILDGSNSMWGQTDGKNKIVVARDSIATLLEGGANEYNFGLITYAGSKNSGCSSVKLIGSPAELAPTALLKTINRLNPKGRSPIAAALKIAAQHTQDNGRILLVSDGAESCGGDPCATAQKLKEKYPNLVIDVLGFNPSDEAQLQCIATNSGGQFAFAQNTVAIGNLFTQLKPLIAEKITQENAQPDSKSANSTPEFGSLHLSLGEKNKTDNLLTSFFIYNKQNELVNSFTAQDQVDAQLPTGTYHISALWKGFKQTQTLTVPANNQTDYRFNIANIGTLNLNAKMSDGSPAKANYAIYDTQQNAIAHYVLVDQLSEKLPAGEYRIKANTPQQSKETTMRVDASNSAEYTFTFDK